MKPPSAAFGRITSAKANDGLVKRLTIINNLESELKLTDLESSNSNFKVEIRPIQEGKKYELLVSLVPPMKQGNNTGKIKLKTGIADKPLLEISAFAYVTAPVDVTPTKLILQSKRSIALKRQFYVRNNTKEPFKISNLESTSDALKLQLKNIRNALTYRLTVEIPTEYSPAKGGDKITFNTDHPDVPRIEIPITERTMNKVQKVSSTPKAGARTVA